MPDLERDLRDLGGAVDWPATPQVTPPLGARPRSRRPLAIAVVVVVVAVAIALAVPPARSGIFHFFHLGGVTVQRVDLLPPAEEQSLAPSLGSQVAGPDVTVLLGGPFALPADAGRPQLYTQGGAVSALLATPAPVLLTELQSGGEYLLKKVASPGTSIESFDLAPGVSALWISGKPHVFFMPGAPPRLAGNVLLWAKGDLTYRLEGPKLGKSEATRLAEQIDGT